MARKTRTDAERARAPRSGPHPVAVGLGFAVLALAVYAPALSGPFFSDDQHYVERNVYIQNPSLESWIAIWSPTSIVVGLVENWAPVQLTLHALAWQAFGPGVVGHHVLGVLMHALAATLLLQVFVRSVIAPRLSLGLAAIFLVHPANVEAVAWISQLKTTSAMALMCGALLLHPGRPLLALLAFALALLAKPTAAVALPVALALGRARGEAPSATRWLAGWAVVFAGFAAAELAAFFGTAGRAESLYDGLGEQIRSHVGIIARYAVMAVSGWKLSLFHEPPAARGWLDPWWLGGLVLIAGVGWRCVALLRRPARRSAELAFWLWAAVSFAPVSGIVALPYPMADRYLYFILPGLLGGCALAAPELWSRIAGSFPAARTPAADAARWARVGVVAGGLVIALFGVAANRHAALWARPERLLAQVEQAYPAGQVARLRAARRAAAAGEAATAVRLLEAAVARGFDRLDVLLGDPAYATLRGEPGFDALVDELARALVDRIEASKAPSQPELRVLAQARFVLGDLEGAERAYERALATEGPFRDDIARELEAVRLERRLERVRRP